MSNVMSFGLTAHAEAEVRNAAGEVVDRPSFTSETEQVTVAVDALREAVERRRLTDTDLAALGFTADQITTIRSTP